MFLLVSACASKEDSAFLWPKSAEALPDAQTAITVAIAIYNAQMCPGTALLPAACKRLDPVYAQSRLHAFRYRTSDQAHDAQGDAWFVEPTDQENADFDKRCAGRCIGGELFTMALSVHDGQVLEFYVPQ